MDSSFTAVDALGWPTSQSNVQSSDVRSWPGSSAAPSLAPPESNPPPESDLSGMAQALADALPPSELQQDDDALAFEHVESFNILCVGESGLGKSTFLRDIFAHLDPTKQQEMIDRYIPGSTGVSVCEGASVAAPCGVRVVVPTTIFLSNLSSIYLSQEMKRCVAEQAAKVAELDDLIDRNETESKQCDDKRALELRQEKKTLRGGRDEARAALEAPP